LSGQHDLVIRSLTNWSQATFVTVSEPGNRPLASVIGTYSHRNLLAQGEDTRRLPTLGRAILLKSCPILSIYQIIWPSNPADGRSWLGRLTERLVDFLDRRAILNKASKTPGFVRRFSISGPRETGKSHGM